MNNNLRPVQVLKASGEYEPFSEEKVRSSLKRAGAGDELIEKIISDVKGKLYEGIPTREIYHHVFALLNKQASLTSRYNLKQAIMELGPSGYPFEKFVAGILRQEGYQVKVDQVLVGRCVSHEIDVIAQKGNEHFMVECKFHNQAGIKTDIKTALYTYARFLDVQDAWVKIVGHQGKFHQGWLVTNTKVTSEVVAYGQCVGLRVISWDYPAQGSLRSLIEKSDLHPITCLVFLNQAQKKKLLEAGIVFCRDLLDKKIEFLTSKELQKAKLEVEEICTR